MAGMGALISLLRIATNTKDSVANIQELKLLRWTLVLHSEWWEMRLDELDPALYIRSISLCGQHRCANAQITPVMKQYMAIPYVALLLQMASYNASGAGMLDIVIERMSTMISSGASENCLDEINFSTGLQTCTTLPAHKLTQHDANVTFVMREAFFLD